MVIQNVFQTSKVRLAFVVLLFLSAFFVVYAYIEGFERHRGLLITAGALFLVYLFLHARNFYYVYFRFQGGKITFRYRYSHPLIGAPRAIEIPYKNFARYEIKSSLGALRTNIILYQEVKGKEAKYPAVSVSGLNRNEIEQLKQALNEILAARAGKLSKKKKR